MKIFLATSLLLFSAACGTKNSASVSASDEKETLDDTTPAPEFDCTQPLQGDTDTTLSINVFKETMEVLRSSPTAKFAKLEYSIKKNDQLEIPFEEPLFRCTSVPEIRTGYTVRIMVFKETLLILRKSDSRLYAPKKYDIKTVSPSTASTL